MRIAGSIRKLPLDRFRKEVAELVVMTLVPSIAPRENVQTAKTAAANAKLCPGDEPLRADPFGNPTDGSLMNF